MLGLFIDQRIKGDFANSFTKQLFTVFSISYKQALGVKLILYCGVRS